MSSKTAVLTVASFLLVVLLCSSTYTSYGLPNGSSAKTCTGVYLNGIHVATKCCWNDGKNNWCENCYDNENGPQTTYCKAPYIVFQQGTVNPGNPTNPALGSIIRVPAGASNAPPTGNNTGTLPPGSIFKVPPGTTITQPIRLGCGPGTDNSTCGATNSNPSQPPAAAPIGPPSNNSPSNNAPSNNTTGH